MFGDIEIEKNKFQYLTRFDDEDGDEVTDFYNNKFLKQTLVILAQQ